MIRLQKHVIYSIVLFFSIALISCDKNSDEILSVLQEIKQQNTDLKSQVTALQKTADSLSQALKLTNQGLANLDKRVDSVRLQLSVMLTQINQLGTQMTQANANIIDIQKKIAELQVKCQSLIDLLQQLLVVPNLNNGLLAYYPFTGNAFDSSGNGNNGIVYGAVLTADRFGSPNKAYGFNGVNNYIDIPYMSALHSSSGTINVWVKTVGQINGQRVVFAQPNGRPQLVIQPDINTSPGKARIQWRSSIGTFPGINSLSDVVTGNWVMITAVYSQMSFSIYVNGVLENTATNSLIQDNCSTSNFQIGGFNPTAGCQNVLGYTQMFSGVIDELRLYNRELNQSEINYLFGK